MICALMIDTISISFLWYTINGIPLKAVLENQLGKKYEVFLTFYFTYSLNDYFDQFDIIVPYKFIAILRTILLLSEMTL